MSNEALEAPPLPRNPNLPPPHPPPVPAIAVVTVPAEEEGMTIGEFIEGAGWKKFKQIKLSTHMLGGLVAFLGVAWLDPTFRAQIETVFKVMPHWLQSGLTVAGTTYMIYKRTHKTGQ